MLEEVRKELEKAKADLREEVQFVENASEARNSDAEQLKALKETVNLLQLHGYFRLRGDLFTNANLGQPNDPSGHNFFPQPIGTNNLGVADMRFRLNPVLRVSDRIAVYSQIDALDNAVLGGNALTEPFYGVGGTDPQGAPILSSQVAGAPVVLKRAWAEVETPIGMFAFGRMPFHFGEGMVYNDGNCIDCDFGTTFDGARFTLGPFLQGHLITVGMDYLTEGDTTTGLTTQQYGLPIPLQQLAAGYRWTLQITRVLPPQDVRRRLDAGEWVVQYGALGGFRLQPYQTMNLSSSGPECQPIEPSGTFSCLQKIGGNLGEADGYIQAQYQKFRIAAEGAFFGGQIQDRSFGTGNVLGQSLNFLQGAGIINAQMSFLKQDALLISLLFGVASGSPTPGIKPITSQTQPATPTPGDIEGPGYSCPNSSASCANPNVTAFHLNQDFRIDELMWRYLFTDISGAWFARLEGRYKFGGRPSGGGEDEGFEIGLAAVYSQAIFASATPSGTQTPLGVEFDGSVTYTSHEHFFVGLKGGVLIPLGGLQQAGAQFPTVAWIGRGIVGVTF